LRLIQAIYTQDYTDRADKMSAEWKAYMERSTLAPVDNAEWGSFDAQEANISFFIHADDPIAPKDIQMGEGSGNDAGNTDEDDENNNSKIKLSSCSSFTSEFSTEHQITHIELFLLAKAYGIASLEALSWNKFFASTEVVSFRPDVALWTAEYLYITAPKRILNAPQATTTRNDTTDTAGAKKTLDSNLRKMRMRIVYLLQRCEAVCLRDEPDFWPLKRASESFDRDFTASAFQARWIICTNQECEVVVEPRLKQGECDCAGEGVCRACVAAAREGRELSLPMCRTCGSEMDWWHWENVNNTDITSTLALGEMFHPSLNSALPDRLEEEENRRRLRE
jgi:hypothetical protein